VIEASAAGAKLPTNAKINNSLAVMRCMLSLLNQKRSFNYNELS
jgi:hypothetical protein